MSFACLLGIVLIGCQSADWVWLHLGIKGVRYSHSGMGGGGVRRGACCDIHTTHFGGTAASEGMMQVDTTPIVPCTLSEKHLCDDRNTATQLEHKHSHLHTKSLRQLMM